MHFSRTKLYIALLLITAYTSANSQIAARDLKLKTESKDSQVSHIPVVGIFMGFFRKDQNWNSTWVKTDYIKFTEQSGVRLVPMFVDQPRSELKDMFGKINGLIIPGSNYPIANLNNPNEFSDMV